MGIISKIQRVLFVNLRIKKYGWLSTCKNVKNRPHRDYPLLLNGKGRISFGRNVQIGIMTSPNYYNSYGYIEARLVDSEVRIGNNVAINNGFSAVAFVQIWIGDFVVIGNNCMIIDTDGHDLAIDKRIVGVPKSAPVRIEQNVFLGSNVTILKGVTIGENSVVGNCSVVTKNIPANVIAAGNPAKVIRNL